MNAFIEHHQQAIRFDYSCFDRILLNGVIQVLQNPACVVGFLKEKRQAVRVTPANSVRRAAVSGAKCKRPVSSATWSSFNRPPDAPSCERDGFCRKA